MLWSICYISPYDDRLRPKHVIKIRKKNKQTVISIGLCGLQGIFWWASKWSRDGRKRNWSSSADRDTRHFSSPQRPDCLGAYPATMSNGYPSGISPRVKWLGREAYNLPSAVPRQIMRRNIFSIPPYVITAWWITKHRGNFNITLPTWKSLRNIGWSCRVPWTCFIWIGNLGLKNLHTKYLWGALRSEMLADRCSDASWSPYKILSFIHKSNFLSASSALNRRQDDKLNGIYSLPPTQRRHLNEKWKMRQFLLSYWKWYL
jgi:hypothetical protein